MAIHNYQQQTMKFLFADQFSMLLLLRLKEGFTEIQSMCVFVYAQQPMLQFI